MDSADGQEVIVKRRVVVTGMGIVASIGNNLGEVLASLREGRSGLPLEYFGHTFGRRVIATGGVHE